MHLYTTMGQKYNRSQWQGEPYQNGVVIVKMEKRFNELPISREDTFQFLNTQG